MVINIVKKIVTALVATLCLSLIMSLLGSTAAIQQAQNTVYLSFWDDFVLYTLFSAPVFLVAGILFSIFADRKIQGTSKIVMSYLIAGGLVALLFNLIIIIGKTNSIVSFQFMVTGMLGALIFYGVQLLINKFTQSTAR